VEPGVCHGKDFEIAEFAKKDDQETVILKTAAATFGSIQQSKFQTESLRTVNAISLPQFNVQRAAQLTLNPLAKWPVFVVVCDASSIMPFSSITVLFTGP
jgi:hypothetical protein